MSVDTPDPAPERKDQLIPAARRMFIEDVAFGNLDETLARHGIEPDQRLAQALHSTPTEFRNSDDAVLFNLLKQNPKFLTDLGDVSQRLRNDMYGAGGSMAGRVFAEAVYHRAENHSLGVHDFIRGIFKNARAHGFPSRGHAIDLLGKLALDRWTASVDAIEKALPALQDGSIGSDDFQFLLTVGPDGGLAFRVASGLGSYVQRSESGLLVPSNVMLTHVHSLGAFTSDEIEELEELINRKSAKEEDFQQFFEKRPHFLRQHDYREVHPQVVLERPEGNLIPDFILTNRDVGRAAIAELKLPGPKLVTRKNNRERFSAMLFEARAQLLKYSEWFRSESNRRRLTDQLGMQIYEPKLIVIMGRSADFRDSYDRQYLQSHTKDIEVFTYDDIASMARRRMVFIEK